MNIAEILKYCPKGTKLYSTAFGDVVLDEVCSETNKYPIKIQDYTGLQHVLTEHGYYSYNIPNSECILFPSKDQRDWNKFMPPVKRGDVMMLTDGTCPFITTGELHNDILFNNISFKYICGIDLAGNFQKSYGTGGWTTEFCIPASKEVKKKLFDKMEEAGYRWNADTLELEKIPKFKPFDKVLVKDFPSDSWQADIYLGYLKNRSTPYRCASNNYKMCIPYEGNEYLVGKTVNIY